MPFFSQLPGLFLVEYLALGGRENHIWLVAGFFADRLPTLVDGLRLEQHPHTAAIDCIVHPIVLIACPIADIVIVYFQRSRLLGSSDDTLIGDGLAQIDKKRGDIKTRDHQSNNPLNGRISIRFRSKSVLSTTCLIAGTNFTAPSAKRTW